VKIHTPWTNLHGELDHLKGIHAGVEDPEVIPVGYQGVTARIREAHGEEIGTLLAEPPSAVGGFSQERHLKLLLECGAKCLELPISAPGLLHQGEGLRLLAVQSSLAKDEKPCHEADHPG
jgi:hypothetical protein